MQNVIDFIAYVALSFNQNGHVRMYICINKCFYAILYVALFRFYI